MIIVNVAPTLMPRLAVNRHGLLETGNAAPMLFAVDRFSPSQLGSWSGFLMDTDFGSRLLLVHEASGLPLVMPVSHHFRHLDWEFYECLLNMLKRVYLDDRRWEWVRGQIHALSFRRGRTCLPLSRQRQICRTLGFVLRDVPEWAGQQKNPDPAILSLDLLARLNPDPERRKDEWMHDFLTSLGVPQRVMLA